MGAEPDYSFRFAVAAQSDDVGTCNQGIAMSRGTIDLSKLPEPIRQKLQARLDLLPAEIRQKLLESLGKLPPQAQAELLARGSPMLDKLLDRVEKKLPSVARSEPSSGTSKNPPASDKPKAPAGLYNKTVQRGDRLSLPIGVMVLVVGGLVLLLYRVGLLGA